MDFKDNSVGGFIVFPYLKTDKRVEIGPFLLRPRDDVADLPSEICQHWEIIKNLFYLRDHLKIIDFVWAYIPQETEESIDLLKKLQAFIAFLYVSPFDSDRKPFLSWEHATTVYLTPSPVHIREEDRTENTLPENNRLKTNDWGYVSGYEGHLNWNQTINAIPTTQLYPPVQNLWFNVNQNLSYDFRNYISRTINWEITRVFFVADERKLSKRVFNSLDWFNRSTSLAISEAASLLYLAIAFESLLNIEQAPGVTERFKDIIRTLLGSVDRLDTWASQFYEARSKIVHRGESLHLYFSSNNSSGKAKDKTIQTLPYGQLVDYGRLIFRLCLNAIVYSSLLAQETNLEHMLIDSEERLKSICEILKDSSKSAQERLDSISDLVFQLNKFNFQSNDVIKPQTLIGTSQRIAQLYLEVLPQSIPREVEVALKRICIEGDLITHLDNIYAVGKEFDDWRGKAVEHVYRSRSNELLTVIWVFFSSMRFVAYHAKSHSNRI